MASLTEAVLVISMDEPAYSLTESSQNGRRMRQIKVVRGGKLAEHWSDIGDASEFPSSAVHIPGGQMDSRGRLDIWHTVGQLIDVADKNRASTTEPIWEDRPLVDWDDAYRVEMDSRRMAAGRRGVNGPWFKRMR